MFSPVRIFILIAVVFQFAASAQSLKRTAESSTDRMAVLTSARISRSEVPTCTAGSTATGLTTSETEIWAVVQVASANTGDVARFEWINPAGQTEVVVNFQAIPSPGSYCLNGSLTRPGEAIALTAGTWTLRIVWTSQIQPFTNTLNFSIVQGGPAGGINLVTDWTWSAACNSGNFNGQFRILTQSANGAFQGIYLNTNASDIGTIVGTLTGNTFTFTRSFTIGSSQTWTGTLTSTTTMSGTITSPGVTCTFTATAGSATPPPTPPPTTPPPTTPPPTGGGTGTVTAVTLTGGTFANGTFTSNAQVWDTIPSNTFSVLGFTNAQAGAFLNNTDGTINLAAGTYVTFSQPTPTNLGTAVEIRASFSTGQTEVAVFQVGLQTSAVEWTRLSGSTNIVIAGAAIGQFDRVRQGDGGTGLVPGSGTDNALRMTFFAPAGGTTTPPVTPPPTCNYSLVPTSANVPAAASAGNFFRVDTATGCAWTATTSTTWITLDPPASRTGSGALVYNVAANTVTAPRTGTIAVAGNTFTVTQAAATPAPPPASTGPAVSDGGVISAASGIPASLPGGAIARGSYFSAYGAFGSVQPLQVTAFPLPTILGGVRVILRQGATEVQAIMYFVSSTQINAILPSNAPLGDVDLIVEVNGVQGPPRRIRVVENNFGIFSVAAGQGPGIIQNFVSDSEQPLNSRSRTARFRQIAIVWGTGGGAIAGVTDNRPPAPLANGSFPQIAADSEALVGGQRAEVIFKGRAPCCAGVDVFYIIVPDNAPTGCAVPVQIRVGSTWSNAVTMAIDANGRTCQDPANPFSSTVAGGGSVGTILLSRISALLQIEGLGPLNLTVDAGLGLFNRLAPAGDIGFSSIGSLPPLGACQTLAMTADLQSILGNLSGSLGGVAGDATLLHAGSELTFTAPSGARIPIPLLDAASSSPTYLGLLGGSIPLLTSSPMPLVLNSGRVSVSGPGGRQVGAFSVGADLVPQPTWTNRDQLTTLNRANGATFQWSGGDNARQAAVLLGVSFDQSRRAGAGFLCAAPIGPGSFRVPPSVLGNMPAVPNGIGENSAAVLIFAVVPIGDLTTFNATGIDRGILMHGSINARSVAVQ